MDRASSSVSSATQLFLTASVLHSQVIGSLGFIIAAIVVGVVLGVELSHKNSSSSSKTSSGTSSSSSNTADGADGAVNPTDPNDPSTFEKNTALKHSFYGLAYTPAGSQLPDCGNSLGEYPSFLPSASVGHELRRCGHRGHSGEHHHSTPARRARAAHAATDVFPLAYFTAHLRKSAHLQTIRSPVEPNMHPLPPSASVCTARTATRRPSW